MLNFESFINESSEVPSIVSGSHDYAAKIHKHTENNGTHSIVHSTRNGAMKVSQIKPHSENNKSVISTRKATDLEKKMHTNKFIVSDNK